VVRGADRFDGRILILVILCRRSGARDPGLERIRSAPSARGRDPPTSRADYQTIRRGDRRAARRCSPTPSSPCPVEHGQDQTAGRLRPLFSKLRARFANYGLLGAADTNGRIFCTSEPTSYSSVADQPFFERAMAQPGLAVTQAAADPDPIDEQVLASLGQLQREGRPDIVPAAYRTVSTIANLGPSCCRRIARSWRRSRNRALLPTLHAGQGDPRRLSHRRSPAFRPPASGRLIPGLLIPNG